MPCPRQLPSCPTIVPQANFSWQTGFLPQHRLYTAQVAAADKTTGFDVVFYGDGLVEWLQGTSMGG